MIVENERNLPKELSQEEELVKTITEASSQDMPNVTAMFNDFAKKKAALRVLRLGGLWDAVCDQMERRFDRYPDEISNADLIKYMSTVQDAMDKNGKFVNAQEEAPVLNITNQSINISGEATPELSRESRARVADAIKQWLDRTSAIETEAEDITHTEDNKDGSN